MIYFTSYAENKFDILNKHKVFLRKEEVENALKLPEKIIKRGKFFINYKDGIGVVSQKEGEIIKVITFYPVKHNPNTTN